MTPTHAGRPLLACLLVALFLSAPAAAQAPPDEEEEGAPLSDLPDLEETALPDLIGGNLNVQPESPHEAQETRLCADVRNVGDGDAVNPFDTIFLIDGIDEGNVRVQEPVRQGHAVTLCRNFTIPAGNHQFTIRVDVSGGEGGEVPESDERNNQPPIRHFSVSSEPRPDLTLTSAGVFPQFSETGKPQYFSTTVRNVGRLPSDATTIDIIDESGRIAPPYPVPALEPGQTFDINLATRPEFRHSGNYTVQFILDPNGAIMEEREDNNHRAFSYVINQHPQPDLLVERAQLNGTLVERHPLRMDLRVENLGTQTAYQEGLAVLLSKDDSGDVRVLGNRTFSRLMPGEGVNLSFHFTLLQGNHTLRVRIDPHERETEINETNNYHDTNVTVAPPERVVALPNLVVQALDAAPDDPRPTEVVTLTALVANLGDETAKRVTVEFFADGESVGTATIPRIAPDQQMTVSVTWKPAEYREYALTTQADPENATEEYVEDDNLVFRSLVVRDPSPPSASPPPSGGSGGDGGAPPGDGSGDPADGEAPGTGEPPAEEPPAKPAMRPVEIANLDIATTPEPGKLVGKVDVTLRNPNLDALGSITVKFLVDGQPIKEILVRDLPSAATRIVSSGELELPSGRHLLSVEVRQIGRDEVIRSEADYDATALDDGIPAPGLVTAIAAIAAAALALGQRSGKKGKGRAR